MKKFFSVSSSTEVFHGAHFSVFVDRSDFYWVVSNDHPKVVKGPFDKDTALKIFIDSIVFYNLLKLKGL